MESMDSKCKCRYLKEDIYEGYVSLINPRLVIGCKHCLKDGNEERSKLKILETFVRHDLVVMESNIQLCKQGTDIVTNYSNKNEKLFLYVSGSRANYKFLINQGFEEETDAKIDGEEIKDATRIKLTDKECNIPWRKGHSGKPILNEDMEIIAIASMKDKKGNYGYGSIIPKGVKKYL